MNLKKLTLGGLAGGVVFFLLGYVFYGLLFNSFFETNGTTHWIGSMRPMDKLYWPGLILGNLLMGFLVAYVLLKANSKTIAAGLVTAAITGLLVTGGNDLIKYGVTFLMRIKAVAADVAITTIIFAIAGAIVTAIIVKSGR